MVVVQAYPPMLEAQVGSVGEMVTAVGQVILQGPTKLSQTSFQLTLLHPPPPHLHTPCCTLFTTQGFAVVVKGLQDLEAQLSSKEWWDAFCTAVSSLLLYRG